MVVTEEQFSRITHVFPKQRGNVLHSNLHVLDAIPYATENGCKWRRLPSPFGKWQTIYARMRCMVINGRYSVYE